MRAVRYLVCAVAAITIVFGVILWSGGVLWTFVDLPSLLIVIGIPVVLLRAGWSFREMGEAFRAALSDGSGEGERAEAVRFFAAARRYLVGSSIFSFLVGIVCILKNLSDKTKLGPNLALTLISAFYAVVLILVVCLPLEIASRRKPDVR